METSIIIIGTSGIVLRGEGNTESGTVIIAEGKDKRSLIKIDNGSSISVDFERKITRISGDTLFSEIL